MGAGEWLERRFGVGAAGSTLGREALGGLTTFLTMSYIAVVNPVFLSAAGMPLDGAVLATLLASGFATLLMGLAANLPVALAPGMGLNAFFAYTICVQHGLAWQAGLGLLALVAAAFLLLTLGRVRALITTAVPRTLRFAAAAGIGLFITTIGLQHAGLIVPDAAALVRLGDVGAPHALLALSGLAVTLALLARRVRTAIFGGMAFTAAGAVLLGFVKIDGPWVRLPSGRLPGLEMDLAGALRADLVPFGIALLFFSIFDAMGTLYAVGAEAGLLDERGEFPRLGRALAADAGGALAGAALGTSSVTCYIESATGVSVGARTGLASLVTAACFFAALVFMPLVAAFGSPVPADGRHYFPITAPALIVVGALMVRTVSKIDWRDMSEAVPAFLTLTLMPATLNISHGLAAGFVSYAFMKTAAGKARQVHWLVYVIAVLIACAALGCGGKPPPDAALEVEPAEVTLFAAASLRDVLQDLEPACGSRRGVRLRFNFASSNDLARQILAGAPADVFFSADEAWMEALDREGLVDRPSRRGLLSNRLVIVGPTDGRLSVGAPADLAGPWVRRLALANPEAVPAGKYARAWLEAAGIWQALAPRVIPALDVRAALAAVEAGGADAGIVYRTDAAASRRIRVLFEVPPEEAPPIAYSVAALQSSRAAERARSLVECLASAEAVPVFERRGFIALPSRP